MNEDDFSFHRNKRIDKTYASKRIGEKIRIASKVMDTAADYHFATEHHDLVLRELPGVRHEIKATFTEDNRRITVLTFQKWRTSDGRPIEKIHFSFRADEIPRLLEFLQHVQKLHFPNASSINVRDEDLRVVAISDQAARRLITENLELVSEIARNDITERDIIALGYRRKQLERFNRLLSDQSFFDAERRQSETTPEGLWQAFFEANQWIFGYGLSYVFATGLDHRKLEQTIRGHSIVESGKRVDGLLKTQAVINSLCFVEIKRHDTNLLNRTSYRTDVWAASDELVGGVAQVQETVRGAMVTLTERFRPNDAEGYPTGEDIFNIEPRSFLVIGSLGQFQQDGATNVPRFRCFESFRRNLRQPEVITFDELFHRARFIVDHTSQMLG